MSTPTLRSGTLADADVLAELVNYAGEGLPLYLWERLASAGETAWDVGRARARREQGSFSYRNAVVAELGGEPAGALIGYEIPDRPEPIDPDMPAMFKPLQELENLAPSTWYVNVLAVRPPHRGKGLGGVLLARAQEIGRGLGKRGLSVIVSDGNLGARRLYQRVGYEQRSALPMVKDDWANDGHNWVLMTRVF